MAPSSVAVSCVLLIDAKPGQLPAAEESMRVRGTMHTIVPPQLTMTVGPVCRSAEQLEAEEQAQRDLERLRLIREKRCAPLRSCLLHASHICWLCLWLFARSACSAARGADRGVLWCPL